MVKGIMKVAEALGLTKPLMNEFASQANNVKTKFDDIPPAIDAAAEAQKRKIESLKTGVDLVEKEANAVKAQEQAYNNSVKITDARLNAESAINKMQQQGLQIAYENANTAGERLRIAQQIFQNEMRGAEIAYQQTLLSIQAEQQRLQFRREAAELEARMIQAKGELAAAEADSAEKAALILEKTSQAVAVQRDNIKLLDGQIRAQGKIAGHQKQAAEAQLQSARMTAEQNLKQKLISDEIGMSEKKANALTGRIGESAMKSIDLEGATRRVGQNADHSAHMFIRVAQNASSAADQINRAASAQERLNRANRKKSSGGSSSGGSDTQTAAQGAYWKGGFKKFARGGVVNGPTLGLVGEGGEPEYIIPQSKAAGFAANYLSGQRGLGAIPGFAEGGYATPNVSIQTGPVTQMDGANYVTTQEMTKAVKTGVQQTLQLMRRDIGVRGGLGLS